CRLAAGRCNGFTCAILGVRGAGNRDRRQRNYNRIQRGFTHLRSFPIVFRARLYGTVKVISVGAKLVFKQLHGLAIRPSELADPKRVTAVLAGKTGNCDLVARVQAVLRPSGSGEFVRSREFALPVFDFALIVLHVEVNLAVWINEAKVRDRTLEGERVARIIGGRAVMSKDRNRNNQESKSSNNCEQFCFHRDHLVWRYSPILVLWRQRL